MRKEIEVRAGTRQRSTDCECGVRVWHLIGSHSMEMRMAMEMGGRRAQSCASSRRRASQMTLHCTTFLTRRACFAYFSFLLSSFFLSSRCLLQIFICIVPLVEAMMERLFRPSTSKCQAKEKQIAKDPRAERIVAMWLAECGGRLWLRLRL